MPDDSDKSIDQVKNTIAALEAQRGVLDDAVITASIAALQEKLSALETRAEPVEQQRKQVTLLFLDTVGSTGSLNASIQKRRATSWIRP